MWCLLLVPCIVEYNSILWFCCHVICNPDSKVHGANKGPIWGRQVPGGPHVGPMNFAIWEWLWPGDHPTDGIWIEFEIRSKLGVLWCKICSNDHNRILHMSQQCYHHDTCKISLWMVEHIWNQSIANCHWISNSIKMSLVGRTPGPLIFSNESNIFLFELWAMNYSSNRPLVIADNSVW